MAFESLGLVRQCMLTSDSGMRERRETETDIHTGGNAAKSHGTAGYAAKSHRTARYAEVTRDHLLMTRDHTGP